MAAAQTKEHEEHEDTGMQEKIRKERKETIRSTRYKKKYQVPGRKQGTKKREQRGGLS